MIKFLFDYSSGVPVYSQIIDQIIFGIASGQLKLGEQLPTVRALRERRARVILGTAETEIAEKFELASKKYTDNPVALHLRGMNMLFEGLKEKGSMIIVPSSALDTMNLGAMGGLVSLAKSNETHANE